MLDDVLADCSLREQTGTVACLHISNLRVASSLRFRRDSTLGVLYASFHLNASSVRAYRHGFLLGKYAVVGVLTFVAIGVGDNGRRAGYLGEKTAPRDCIPRHKNNENRSTRSTSPLGYQLRLKTIRHEAVM